MQSILALNIAFDLVSQMLWRSIYKTNLLQMVHKSISNNKSYVVFQILWIFNKFGIANALIWYSKCFAGAFTKILLSQMAQQSIFNNKFMWPSIPNTLQQHLQYIWYSKYFVGVPSFNPSSCCSSARPRHSSTLLSRFYTFLLYFHL